MEPSSGESDDLAPTLIAITVNSIMYSDELLTV